MTQPPNVQTARHVGGVDGCPGGWLLVHHPQNNPQRAEWQIFETFAELFKTTATFLAVAIDIPIGLPKIATKGGRTADRQARAVLGARQSSVFSVPARTVLSCTDYRDACARSLRHSDPPRKVSKQIFHLFPKIREVDAAMSPNDQRRIVECHPEVAFWALNAKHALSQPKKVKSKPHEPGLDQRRRLLLSTGFDPEFLAGPTIRRRLAGPDDFLDACAASWTANRLASGMAERFPAETQEIDDTGLAMQITY